jgi:predicted RNA methylase
MLIVPQHIVRRKQFNSLHTESYDEHWKYLSFKNKNILDIGADYGSTVSYFIKLGASKVVAIEGNPKLASDLKKNYEGNNNVVCIEKFIRKSEDVDRLLETYRPDVVKCDIEGWETCLLKAKISLVNEWLIEVHDPIVLRQLLKKFRREKFEVRCKPYFNWNFIFQAKKENR